MRYYDEVGILKPAQEPIRVIVTI
ncbi:hypothetical protein ACE41H_15815 [Paenibacillus enshidis]|uniref:HTH merR-type domain-containing protein n=1 Tax=Paenibacillus enshidis TaxID=1458439 RepID=A0ABV5AVJ6_9BACL